MERAHYEMTTPSATATTARAVPVPSPQQSYGLHLAADLRSAENELRHLRGQLRQATAFINDPAHDLAARRALAERLGLPEPSSVPALPRVRHVPEG